MDKKIVLGKLQSPKKSQLSGRQTLTCKFFPDCLETLQTVRNLSRLSENFPNRPEISRLSGKCPYFPDTSYTAWKLSRLSRNFFNCLETFQTVRKLFQLPENFPDCPESFKTYFFSYLFFLGPIC